MTTCFFNLLSYQWGVFSCQTIALLPPAPSLIDNCYSKHFYIKKIFVILVYQGLGLNLGEIVTSNFLCQASECQQFKWLWKFLLNESFASPS
jgi:hypothetical protein